MIKDQAKFQNSQYKTTLENHCTQTVQSLRAGCSRQGHKIVYLAVKKGNILPIFYFWKHNLLIRVFWPSDHVVDCNILIFWTLDEWYNTLNYSKFAYSYITVGISANDRQKYAKLSIPSLIRIVNYVMSLNHSLDVHSALISMWV